VPVLYLRRRLPAAEVFDPPPFKWTQVGIKHKIWSDTVESTCKDVKRYFGIFKRRWRCFSNPIEIQDPDHIERLFAVCAILHNIFLDYDGIDDWEVRMKKAKIVATDDTFDLDSVNFHQSRLRDDTLYNEEGMNYPSADCPCLFLNFHSNEQTGREMTHRLRIFIGHFFIAKEKKEIRKLEKNPPEISYLFWFLFMFLHN
jgi:hypothetical protein